MKVAFATSDLELVNEQFRSASHLVVYEITPGASLLERICVLPLDRKVGTDDRIRAIDGASIVFVSAIGPSLAVRLAQQGIRVATTPSGTRIAAVLAWIGARAYGDEAPRELGASSSV